MENMYVDIVTHPCKLCELEQKLKIKFTIIKSENSGPIGMIRYKIKCNLQSQKDELMAISAKPFCISIQTDVLECYSINDFVLMCKLMLKKLIKKEPLGFETIKFADPRTTHLYPLYGNSLNVEYLFVCDEERRFLFFEPLYLLGLFPVTDEKIYYSDIAEMSMPTLIMFMGSLLIRSEDKSISVINLIEKLRLITEKRKRDNISHYTKNNII
jgi:hypothetical protein